MPSDAQNPTKMHVCPKGHALTARALADSDDRIWASWLECETCGWNRGGNQFVQHIRQMKERAA